MNEGYTGSIQPFNGERFHLVNLCNNSMEIYTLKRVCFKVLPRINVSLLRM